ncbi:hypothetical protein MMC30_006198 [Trapelia coarctata]|nr:hypothetical protein [Trapelia coarctata]
MDFTAFLRKVFKSIDREPTSTSTQLGVSGVSSLPFSREDPALKLELHANTVTLDDPAAKSKAVCKFLMLPTEVRLMIYRQVFELPRRVYVCPTDTSQESLSLMDAKCHTRVYGEILRASRQIHDEAAPELYSELTIVMWSGNNLASGMLVPPIFDQKPWKIYDNVWRHNPLLGVGHRDSNGAHVYDTPAMDGLMEPHIFAKFKNVDFEVEIGNPN